MPFFRPSGVLQISFVGRWFLSRRTFDKDCDGKLKPEELLGILTWDESKLPEGLQEVIKEFQDSDGLISYEGIIICAKRNAHFGFSTYLQVWLVS